MQNTALTHLMDSIYLRKTWKCCHSSAYVCIHTGNLCEIGGSIHSVLVCYRGSALCSHLMLPSSSFRDRITPHSPFPARKRLFYGSATSSSHHLFSELKAWSSFNLSQWRNHLMSLPFCPSLCLHWIFCLFHFDVVHAVFKCGQIWGSFSGTELLFLLPLVAFIPYVLFTFPACRRAMNRCFC